MRCMSRRAHRFGRYHGDDNEDDDDDDDGGVQKGTLLWKIAKTLLKKI